MTVDTALVSAFALAIAKPGERARMLKAVGSSKVAAGWLPIEEAAESGLPFMHDLRDGVVTIDVDRSEGDQLPSDAIGAAESIGAAVVRVGSGREDNEHVFIVGPVGWCSRALVDLLVENGVKPGKIRQSGADVNPHCPRIRRGLVAH